MGFHGDAAMVCVNSHYRDAGHQGFITGHILYTICTTIHQGNMYVVPHWECIKGGA